MSAAEGKLVCGAKQAYCVCDLPPHDTGPHLCECSGSWVIEPDGGFSIHSLPDPTTIVPRDMEPS